MVWKEKKQPKYNKNPKLSENLETIDQNPFNW